MEFGTFDRDIPVAMCNARILESGHRRVWRVPKTSWLVEEHIFRETSRKQPQHANLPAAIILATNTLTPKESGNSEFDKEQIVRKLSRAAACELDIRAILSYLKPEAEQKEIYLRHKSTTNHVVSAAAYLGDLSFFEKLYPQHENIDSSENIYFGNPLRCAILQGHLDLVRFMLDQNVDVNKAGSGTGFGSTALEAAASSGRRDLVDLILEPEYGCTISGENFENAVLEAASAGHLTMVRHLIQRFAMDVTLELSNHPLMEACKRGVDLPDRSICELVVGSNVLD